MNLVLYGVTSDTSLSFCRGHVDALKAEGFEVAFVSAPGPALRDFALSDGSNFFEIPMRRELSLLSDFFALLRLIRLIRRLRPVLTNFGTPKAGLLGNIAAFMCRVPHRVYTLHGLRLETARGWKFRLLTLSEKIACLCAHRVICVGPTLQQQAIQLGLVEPEKVVVLANGTCNGIDADLFAPVAANFARADQLRETLGLPKGVPVIGFVGRFTRDKGIPELLEAYLSLRSTHPELRLLLVGRFEEGDPVPQPVRDVIEADRKIFCAGFVSDTSPYYHLMDLLALPTYREGFPLVPLEAQAAGLPVVVTNATGANDSVRHGETGLLVPVGDAAALAEAMGSLLDDPAKRAEMGRKGQAWVRSKFDGDHVRAELMKEYHRMLQGELAPGDMRGPQSADRNANIHAGGAAAMERR
jgi:glycosyltransferase involved in cell wall biosynthesis